MRKHGFRASSITTRGGGEGIAVHVSTVSTLKRKI